MLKLRSSFHIIIVLTCLFTISGIGLAFPDSAHAEEEALIENIKLANTRDDLLVYFDVKGAFTDKITQAVMSGVPTAFSFYVLLHDTDGSFFDKKVADIEIKSTIKYNPLKKEYSVLRPWKSEKPVTTQSFKEAKELMTEINNLTIIKLDQLVKGHKYQLRIKAELDKVTLPLSLHYVLFFVSFWDFETNWYLINFTF